MLSLAGATLGVIESASLAVGMIGQGLALARGRLTKRAVKQVDRLLSNPGIDVDALLRHWVPYVVGSRSSVTVAMDWTSFDADGQTTIMLSLLCGHGRATPLVWLTVETATLKARRNAYAYQVLARLAEALPVDVGVRIVADRGFGDQKLYRVLTEELKFDFVIRFRGNIMVTAADGEARPAADWVGAGGRARVLRGAMVTAAGYAVGAVVCVQAKAMKEPWCLAVSSAGEPARSLIDLYAKRWGIECAFRDTKDLRLAGVVGGGQRTVSGRGTRGAVAHPRRVRGGHGPSSQACDPVAGGVGQTGGGGRVWSAGAGLRETLWRGGPGRADPAVGGGGPGMLEAAAADAAGAAAGPGAARPRGAGRGDAGQAACGECGQHRPLAG